MNKKGFTVVELITTFAVASVIALVLFNVVITIKNIYSKTNIKTNLLIDQANLSNQINVKTINNDIISMDVCSESDSNYCYVISYSDGSEYNLIIKKNRITFGNYVYKLDNNSYIDEDNISIGYETDTTVTDNSKDSILIIKIPIKNKLFNQEDFGLNYIYLYKSGEVDFNNIISNFTFPGVS